MGSCGLSRTLDRGGGAYIFRLRLSADARILALSGSCLSQWRRKVRVSRRSFRFRGSRSSFASVVNLAMNFFARDSWNLFLYIRES